MPVRRLGAITGVTGTGGLGYRAYIRRELTRLAAAQGIALPLPDPDDPAEVSPLPPATTVFLADDRWLIQCPNCATDCSFVWPETQLYMCPVCWNVGASGLYRRHIMPADWRAVDAAAGLALFARRRNWIPTGAALHGELAQHKHPEQTAAQAIQEFRRGI